MEWLRQLGRAIRNLARISRQNPIWAITAFTLSPIRLIRHLLGVLFLFLATAIVLGLGMQFIFRTLIGLAHDSNLYQTIMMLTGLVVILITLRALFQPLILAYGGPDGDDTHGWPSRPQAAILAKSENVLGTWHSVLTMEIIEEDSSLHHREWVDGSEYSGRGFDRTMEPELCRY